MKQLLTLGVAVSIAASSTGCVGVRVGAAAPSSAPSGDPQPSGPTNFTAKNSSSSARKEGAIIFGFIALVAIGAAVVYTANSGDD